MKKAFAIIRVLIAILFVPAMALAATQLNLKTFVEGPVISYLKVALELMMTVAALMFIWYMIQYFVLNNGGEKRKEAGLYLLYSILGFFVIVSFWGLVYVVQNSFGLSNADNAPTSWTSFTNIFPTN
ncbi:MAG: hypothetical protein KGJ33_03055 [Patescibacteria group bacterium]|nr:hypothetical protein [Patescibacteria group bacterium]